MSTPTTEPTPTPAAPVAPVPTAPAAQPTPPADPAPAKETDWVAEARKWEARAKENSDAAKKLAAIEEANKSELEKANDRAAKAEQKAIESDRKAFAAEKGIPVSLVTGSTPEQWEAAAAEALAWRGEVPKPPVAPSATGQGKVGEPVGATVTQLTDADLERMTPTQINQARREGRLKSLLG